MMKINCILLVICLWNATFGTSYSAPLISTAETNADRFESVECKANMQNEGSAVCLTDSCGRRIVDNLFSTSDVEKLHAIVNKGMSYRENKGGPTILDINTGYIRDSDGLANLFVGNTAAFSDEDFAHYGRIITTLKAAVADTFKLKELYFTAPTFITRLDGNPAWQPKEMHDEYWHPHADHNNTAHYHYSGLLYMSTYNEDFTGGKFKFIRPEFDLFEHSNLSGSPDMANLATPTDEDVQLEVEPRAGRVVIFTAGHENTHYVERVTSGQRFVLSFWFTCDPKREFEIFLDGKAHTTFSQKIRDSHRKRQAQQAAAKSVQGVKKEL